MERGTWKSRLVSPPRLETVATIYLALAGWHANLPAISDNSTFLHLRTGQWMLAHGLVRADVFSFTAAGAAWVPESWLADLLYGLSDRVLGPSGLLMLNAAIGAAIGGLWFRLALRVSRDTLRATFFSLASLAVSYTVWSPRPLMFGILAFLSLVYLIEAPESAAGRHTILLIPPLFWVWANTHGSFVLGFVYLGLHLAGRWVDGAKPWRARERELLIAGAIAFPACFINPYGYRLLTAPFHLLLRYPILENVVEWRRASFTSLQGAAYLAWLFVFATAMLTGSRNMGARGLVVSLPFIVSGLCSERNIVIVPIVTFPIAAGAWAARVQRAPNPIAFNWVMVALAGVLAISWTTAALRGPALVFRGYPVGAMRLIRDKGLLGRRLLSSDLWGGYIVLEYGPEQRVFMDDRYDLYPTAVAEDMLSLLNKHGDWLGMVRKYDIDVVVWPVADKRVRSLAKSPDWKEIYRDNTAIVMLKSSAAGKSEPAALTDPR